jgi:hypothetical protein
VGVVAPAHVLDRDGAEMRGELPHRRGRIALPRHQAMAEVERERQPRQVRPQHRPVVQRLHQHARLRLQRHGDAMLRGVFHHLRDALQQPLARLAAIDARQRHAGPEGDRLRLQDVADVDRALEEADAPGPAFRLRRQQRRLVLAARVEQEARPRLDDAAEPPRAELARQRLGPPHPAFRHGSRCWKSSVSATPS